MASLRSRQTGSGIVLVLLGITVMIGALIAYAVDGTNVVSMAANNNTVITVSSQASLIRARILQCGTDYPSGNNGTGFNINYPAASTATAVSALVCPGNGVNLWAQSDGVVMPVSPAGFGAWNFTNDGTGMRLTMTASTAPAIQLLPNLTAMLGPQASLVSPTITWTIK